MRLLLNTPADRVAVAQEILALVVDRPMVVEVKRATKRLTTAQQAIVHSMIRAIARHAQAQGIPATEESVKQQAKANQIEGVNWPGEWKAGFGSDAVWLAKGTMDLTAAECRDLIDQLGAFGGAHGVEWEKVDNWTEEVA